MSSVGHAQSQSGQSSSGVNGMLEKGNELKKSVLDHLRNNPIITGIALVAIGSLVLANAFGVIDLSALKSLGTGTTVVITAGLLVLTYGAVHLSKKYEESQQDPKQKTLAKTVLSAMKILLPAVALGLLALGTGYGGQFFGSDLNNYAQVAAYTAAMVGVSLGIYSLVTGSFRKYMEKRLEKHPEELPHCVKATSQVNNFSEALVYAGCIVGFALTAYVGFNLMKINGFNGGNFATVAVSLFVGCFVFQWFSEKVSNALRGVKDPVVDLEMRKLAKNKKPAAQPNNSLQQTAPKLETKQSELGIPIPESNENKRHAINPPQPVDPYAGYERTPYTYNGQTYESVNVQGRCYVWYDNRWYAEEVFKKLERPAPAANPALD